MSGEGDSQGSNHDMHTLPMNQIVFHDYLFLYHSLLRTTHDFHDWCVAAINIHIHPCNIHISLHPNSVQSANQYAERVRISCLHVITLFSIEKRCWRTYRNLSLNLPDRSVQLPSNHLFLVCRQEGISFTQIAIDHSLHRNIITSVNQVISARQWCILRPQMLLQSLEEVHIFSADKGNQYAKSAL